MTSLNPADLRQPANVRLVVDEPLAGHYLAPSRAVPKARLKKDQLWVPAMIYWSVPSDPDAYHDFDRPPLKAFCEVDGIPADPYVMWPILAGNPITKEEYERRTKELERIRSIPNETVFDEPEDDMNINNAFPSNYLKASELQGRDVTVTMANVVFETIGQERKPVLYFNGAKKGMVLNKTNSNSIAALYGPETDTWTGKKITLFPTAVDYQGKSVDAIRIRGVAPAGNGHAMHQGQPAFAGAGKAGPLPQGQPSAGPLDDDIPFAAEWRA